MKKWVNSLTTQQVRAYACQHGNRKWRTDKRTNLIRFILGDLGAKDYYYELYGKNR